ncbi:glucuronate isomerase [soil metagenome]
MKDFLDDNFLLETKTAEYLYHEHAKKMPIIDYHCHLPPAEIANNHQFENLTKIWLDGDHYKWRAMRSNGVPEKYCTGNAPDFEKFQKWAETVPYTLRNPLYHWTHMELKDPFGIDRILDKSSAKEIYETCSAKLQAEEYRVKNLLLKNKVEVICTTDDPIDSLEHHKKIKEDGFEIKVLPAWRPDNAIAVEDVKSYNSYLDKLEEVSGVEVSDFNSYLDALEKRHTFFHQMGCRLSDHGLEKVYAEEYTDEEIKGIFNKIRTRQKPGQNDILKFKSAMLVHFGIMDHSRGWVQQYHLGALRNNSSRMNRVLGPNTGFDSIGDFPQGADLSKFLSRLDDQNQLAKTIFYNLNPADNELFATMAGNFNDGSVPGKMQFGSAWWFLDQKDGMEKQMNALSNMGLLSLFVGMITDSRSFLSYSRHEYFRRILCNLFGNDIENGELPAEMEWIGQVIENICYFNAKSFFKFK